MVTIPGPPSASQLRAFWSRWGKWITGGSGLAIIGTGFTMIGVDEYVAAIVCWCLAGMCFWRVVYGVFSGHRKSPPAIISAIASGIIPAIVVAILWNWTLLKRDGKPWSLYSRYFVVDLIHFPTVRPPIPPDFAYIATAGTLPPHMPHTEKPEAYPSVQFFSTHYEPETHVFTVTFVMWIKDDPTKNEQLGSFSPLEHVHVQIYAPIAILASDQSQINSCVIVDSRSEVWNNDDAVGHQFGPLILPFDTTVVEWTVSARTGIWTGIILLRKRGETLDSYQLTTGKFADSRREIRKVLRSGIWNFEDIPSATFPNQAFLRRFGVPLKQLNEISCIGITQFK